MFQWIFGFLFSFLFVSAASAQGLPIAPRRHDALDQVSKTIFSSTSGIDPKEGLEADTAATSAGSTPSVVQAAPLKTAETSKNDEKNRKLKQTSANGKKKTTKLASAKKITPTARKPAAAVSAKRAPAKKSSPKKKR